MLNSPVVRFILRYSTVFARLAVGAVFLSNVADRLGPEVLVPVLGWFVNIAEIVLGLLLIVGFKTRWAGLVSGLHRPCDDETVPAAPRFHHPHLRSCRPTGRMCGTPECRVRAAVSGDGGADRRIDGSIKRRSLRDVVNAIEPSLEIIEIRSTDFPRTHPDARCRLGVCRATPSGAGATVDEERLMRDYKRRLSDAYRLEGGDQS